MASPFPMGGYGPPPPDPGAPDQQDSGTFADQIKAALDKIRSAIQQDGGSAQDKLILEKMTTLGQQLLATHEKDQQAALGSSPAMNFVRRATGG